MKMIKNYDSFVNEELFGKKHPTEKEKDEIDKFIKQREQVQSEENDEVYNMFHEEDQKINLKDFNKQNAGGTEGIKYKDFDIIIDKSPLSHEAKEANDRGKKITYIKSQDFRKKLFVKTKDGVKCYLIDATHVRDYFDVDFTMGGHGYVYPNYIPEDEVWIDEEMNKEDEYATTVHELTERTEMRNKHLKYNKAHDDASAKEIEVRHKIDKEKEKE